MNMRQPPKCVLCDKTAITTAAQRPVCADHHNDYHQEARQYKPYRDRTFLQRLDNFAASEIAEAQAFEQALLELQNLTGVDYDDLHRIVTVHMKQGSAWRDVIGYLRDQILKKDLRWIEA